MIVLFSLLVQFQSFAKDVVDSRVNPAVIERTAESARKIKINLPVEFTHNVCVETVNEPYTYYRSYYGPCGGYYGGYRGGYYRSCYYGQYPYTSYVTRCVRSELKTTTEIRDIVLKFKKGTELSGNDLEKYSIKVEQRHLDSNALYITVDPTHTVKPYNIQSKGRRVIFRSK